MRISTKWGLRGVGCTKTGHLPHSLLMPRGGYGVCLRVTIAQMFELEALIYAVLLRWWIG